MRCCGPGPLSPETVALLLTAAGYPDVSSYGRSDAGGIQIGVSTGSGCVYGGVHDHEVELQIGSPIADGGYLAAQGH